MLDPCGGVGTIPIVDALVRPGSGLVVDLSTESIELAHNNIRAFGLGDRVFAEEGDATDLDLADGSVDRVVSDVPFGKKVGSNLANDTLYPRLVAELARVLAGDGRAVIVTDAELRRQLPALAKELKRRTARTIELASLNPAHPDRVVNLGEVAWMARVMWVRQ